MTRHWKSSDERIREVIEADQYISEEEVHMTTFLMQCAGEDLYRIEAAGVCSF
jgi:hypothetical protein